MFLPKSATDPQEGEPIVDADPPTPLTPALSGTNG
jgi:hypothetical protein